jgi:DMSO/TMAO reductase YedYZ molybdopterin-dependent catalytic subunit
MMPDRRQALRGGLSLGALTLLTGCNLSDHDTVQRILARFSEWNDQVQAALFSERRLAPTFPETMAVKDFRYNAWYGPEKAPRLDPADYRLQLAGRIDDKRPWTVDDLYALPQVNQVTRHVCVEGWSMIGKWSGTPLRTFLERIGADTTARYVGFECADGYYEGIDMPTALHPQTLMAFSGCRTRSCRRSTGIHSRSASRPSLASRIRSSSPRSMSPTSSHAAIGPIAATTGSVASE